jgi:ABC-type amino acid transport substrate-binding protein
MARLVAAFLSLLAVLGTGTDAFSQNVPGDGGVVEFTEADRAEDALVAAMAAPCLGDLDDIVPRGFLRVGVPYEPLFFVNDGGEQRGIAVDTVRKFEAHLRATLGPEARSLTVALMPLSRINLIDSLISGREDVLSADLTITPSRAELVDFADPMLRDVRELAVTGPAAPAVASLDDLAFAPVHVRPSSSYHEHLESLNASRAEAGLFRRARDQPV